MVGAHFLFQLQARRLGSRCLHFSHLNPFLSLVLIKNQRLVGVSPLCLHVPVWSDADLVSPPSLGPLTPLPMEPELQLVHGEGFSKLTCGSGRKQVCTENWVRGPAARDYFTVSVGWGRGDREQA